MKWILLSMSLIFVFSCSQRKYTLVHAISGYVSDVNNNPLEGVTVEIYDPKGIPYNSERVISDAKGHFFFGGMWESSYQSLRIHRVYISYTITIQKGGYVSDTINLEKYVFEIDSIDYAIKKESPFDTISVPPIQLKLVEN